MSATKVVLLGTGTPNVEPDRAGSSVAIVVNEVAYLVDFGAGVVHRAAIAATQGESSLQPANLSHAFLTHLHSDHTVGLADLLLSPWVLGRQAPLHLWGPPGTRKMANHLLTAYQADIEERLSGLEPANATGCQIEVTEIEPGLIFTDEHIRVEAWAANHGRWPAFSYRFTTSDRVIVISGDTAPYPDIAAHYKGCDLLIHEVYSATQFKQRPAAWQKYHAAVHTSTTQLAAIANEAQPGLLVLTHQLFWGQTPAKLVAEIQADYAGDVISGNDLDCF